MKRLFFSFAIAVSASCAWAEGASVFSTPQDAFDAMRSAVGAPDPVAPLIAVFGDDALDVLSTGNPERDAESGAEFRALLADGYRFQPDGDDRVTLLLGADGWPFPIPIARVEGGWAFDLEAGLDELYYRRIGENELHVIDVMAAYVDIQIEYRLADHDGDGVMEFANALLSNPGAKDGLFWDLEDGPLGERIARAALDGYSVGDEDRAAEPYGGYYYRILTAQSDAAPGGEMSYEVNGNMLAGHALLAVPSDYGVTGIHSFMVAENGVVLQADLGEDSLDEGFDMTSYDPGPAWTPAD